MRALFKISFRGKYREADREKIAELILINSEGTLQETRETEDEKKMIIKGKFFSLNPLDNTFFNLWTGFSGKAELTLKKDHTVIYTVDLTWGVAWVAAVLLFLLLSPMIYSIRVDSFYLGFVEIVLVLSVLSLLIRIFRHRQMFRKTLQLRNKMTGNYDWAVILKKKTDPELRKIAAGDTLLPDTVRDLAKEELKRKKQNKINFRSD